MILFFLLLCIILSELTYSIASKQQLGFNPYPFATPRLCLVVHISILANCIFYGGWILGTIIFACCLFALCHVTVGWPLSLIPTVVFNNDKKFIKFSYFELGMLIPAILISILFFLISLSTVEFACLLSYMQFYPETILIFLLVAGVMSLIRHFVFKSTQHPQIQNKIEPSVPHENEKNCHENLHNKDNQTWLDTLENKEDYFLSDNENEAIHNGIAAMDMCCDIILKYEAELTDDYISSKDVITDKFYDYMYANRYRLLKENEIHFAILNICYNLIASGDFHSSPGKLDEHSEAPALCLVFDNCINWLHENKYLSTEEYNETCANLQQKIENTSKQKIYKN